MIEPADGQTENGVEASGEPVPAYDQEWSTQALEEAYLRALDTLDDVEVDLSAALDEAESEREAAFQLDQAPAAEHAETGRPESGESEGPKHNGVLENVPRRPDEDSAPPTPAAEQPQEAAASLRPDVSPREIVEAALFVGGMGLTAKKLASTLGGSHDAEFVDAAIAELNELYAAERRPYEIRFTEGGYRLQLCEAFERVRHKVFGLGPKDVRLSQETLEVLAIVAYRQPITRAEIEKLERPNPSGILRQLLRRELIAVERDLQDPQLVRYRTSERFLKLFGLAHIDDLPQADELEFK